MCQARGPFTLPSFDFGVSNCPDSDVLREELLFPRQNAFRSFRQSLWDFDFERIQGQYCNDFIDFSSIWLTYLDNQKWGGNFSEERCKITTKAMKTFCSIWDSGDLPLFLNQFDEFLRAFLHELRIETDYII